MSVFILKIIAYIAMFSDHVGVLFLDGNIIFRAIGRISFPIFAFLVAVGFTKTSNVSKYVKRLFIFALISQIPFTIFIIFAGADRLLLNIFFSLLAGLIVLILVEKKKYAGLTFFVVFLIILEEVVGFDYGIYGTLLILFSYIFIKYRTIGLSLLLLVTAFASLDFVDLEKTYFQIYALAAIPILMMYNGKIGKKFNRWIFYSIYPLHFLILLCVYYLIK